MNRPHLSKTPIQVLKAHARPATTQELASIPWLKLLTLTEQEHAEQALMVNHVPAGTTICRIGRSVTYWFGLIDGLLKMSNDEGPTGESIIFTGVAPGGWFGEGTVIKRECYRYNIQTLRTSLVAGLPAETFHWLLDRSLGFNRFILNQLNDRLGQFIAAREIDRISDPECRVARHLASLFHPTLAPNVSGTLHITQQELAYLVGLSRQRVNEALHQLQAKQWIRIEYGGLRVLNLAALRAALPET